MKYRMVVNAFDYYKIQRSYTGKVWEDIGDEHLYVCYSDALDRLRHVRDMQVVIDQKGNNDWRPMDV